MSRTHPPSTQHLTTTAPREMAKTLKLNPDEAQYLLRKVSKQKFGLDDDEDRLMVLGIRSKLLDVQGATEPMFPTEEED